MYVHISIYIYISALISPNMGNLPTAKVILCLADTLLKFQNMTQWRSYIDWLPRANQNHQRLHSENGQNGVPSFWGYHIKKKPSGRVGSSHQAGLKNLCQTTSCHQPSGSPSCKARCIDPKFGIEALGWCPQYTYSWGPAAQLRSNQYDKGVTKALWSTMQLHQCQWH